MQHAVVGRDVDDVLSCGLRGDEVRIACVCILERRLPDMHRRAVHDVAQHVFAAAIQGRQGRIRRTCALRFVRLHAAQIVDEVGARIRCGLFIRRQQSALSRGQSRRAHAIVEMCLQRPAQIGVGKAQQRATVVEVDLAVRGRRGIELLLRGPGARADDRVFPVERKGLQIAGPNLGRVAGPEHLVVVPRDEFQ
ncbi:hypothetical protein D3C86_1404460 [compost metagenome]